MFVFDFCGLTAVNEYVELIKMFLRPSEFRVLNGGAVGDNGTCAETSDAGITGVLSPTPKSEISKRLSLDESAEKSSGRSEVFGYIQHRSMLEPDVVWRIPKEFDTEHLDKNALKRCLYDFLRDAGLKTPEWGILTGVRPVKLLGELALRGKAECTAENTEHGTKSAKCTAENAEHETKSAECAAENTEHETKSAGITTKFHEFRQGKDMSGSRCSDVSLPLIQRDKANDAKAGATDAALKCLKEEYYLADDKLALLKEIYELQNAVLSAPLENSVGIYVGIPFCPTRCEYCSFPSNQVQYDKIVDYLEALKKEIRFTASGMRMNGLFAESIYIGGGTPTTLNDRDLDDLLGLITEFFSTERLSEFTVEAGRPDTIDAGKLRVLRNRGVTRISINPQSLKNETLRLIGRDHDGEAVRRAFMLARDAGIAVINSDIIAGLPGEEPKDFEGTLRGILEFAPEDVTVHTLALKRAARLKEADSEYHYRQAEAAAEMLELAHGYLTEAGYRAYYLYRQKQMAGNLENTGYAKNGCFCLYNMRIMEENQTIIALGAGASTKRFYPDMNRLERVFNVSNYEIYVERIEEMLARKRVLLEWV